MTDPDPLHAQVLASGLCNVLYPLDHAGKTGLGMVDGAVRLVGNWVGGSFTCFPDRIIFQMNGPNEPFQSTPNGRFIKYEWITRVSPGRMLLFAETVDIHTEYGLFRIRTARRHRQTLYRLLPHVQT